MSSTEAIEKSLNRLANLVQAPLALLPHKDFAEKLINLELHGVPDGLPDKVIAGLDELRSALSEFDVQDTKVVVLGGGTGLSNIIGGDSRKDNWPELPFHGLKDIFPQTKAIVCVTDDGGSTGELLKDLPYIALGDLRHVLLSSIRQKSLQAVYGLDELQCMQVAKSLHKLFNYRFDIPPESIEKLSKEADLDAAVLPKPMYQYLAGLLDLLFSDPGLSKMLGRPHCLGNLLLAAAIWQADEDLHQDEQPDELCQVPLPVTYNGLGNLCRILALAEDAVMPCSLTPACLQVLYSNGALVTGEFKSGYARRGYPVDRLFVRFVEEPQLPDTLLDVLASADIIVLAPGSLYTSTIPIFQVPGLAEAVCSNEKALKILVANLWVQKGETDVVRDDPKRRFYVSDLIKAYHRNIPGGVSGLFSHVLSLGFQEISGSILQNYATEDKVPIFLDREKVAAMGFISLEAGIFSQAALQEHHVVQHDPAMLARSVRTLLAAEGLQQPVQADEGLSAITEKLPGSFSMGRTLVQKKKLYPCERYAELAKCLQDIEFKIDYNTNRISNRIEEILCFHQDILLEHLANVRAIQVMDRAAWSRNQEWDNLYSFYDPDDQTIKICQDVVSEKHRFEQAFLIALGQALLGNYAAAKFMEPVEKAGENVGKLYKLSIKHPEDRNSFLSDRELSQYLKLARMIRSGSDPLLYTRLVNGNEGFTPPGLLFGLIYAWYLDNRFAAHVEYKMAVMRTDVSDLIPEQVRMNSRRRALVQFFRLSVFCHSAFIYDEIPQL